MHSAPPDPHETTRTPVPVKVLVAGGFGVGKTTLVGTMSDITPLRTEAPMTALSVGVDDTSAVQDKTTTTVALDFGRSALSTDLVLYMFGTPGQDRFLFMWDELATGAVGAIVLVDTRRLADAFGPVAYFEKAGLPFVIAVNQFPGSDAYPEAVLREALAVDPDVPITTGDARDPASSRHLLVTLVQHALGRARTAGGVAQPVG
ncbi:GTP-binding protein [Aquipuribacter sp. MA13-6]|uniref:GTP-binding protein n=1 Tax=unclassified Aquipuribacter TaxID=2635084 RepID=UPI003EEF9C25